MSCSKSCECRDKCTNKPFRKERRVKVVKVSKVQPSVVLMLISLGIFKTMSLQVD